MARTTLLLALVPLLCGCNPEGQAPDDAADTTSASAEVAASASLSPVEQGRELYVQYCQSCHGPEAKGNGPVAELLTISPTDLTLISERNGDVFPVDQVAAYIDGREDVKGHGSRDMPVWGNVWTDEVGGAEAEQEMAHQISLLVEYLRSTQEDIPDA